MMARVHAHDYMIDASRRKREVAQHWNVKKKKEIVTCDTLIKQHLEMMTTGI